jgi:hypothetical protein
MKLMRLQLDFQRSKLTETKQRGGLAMLTAQISNRMAPTTKRFIRAEQVGWHFP